MTSDWICQCCRILFVAMALELCHQNTTSLGVAQGNDFYPASGADLSNVHCVPAQQRVLLRQLGPDQRFGQRRKLSLHGSDRSHRKIPKQISALMDTEGSADHYQSGNLQLDEFLAKTFANISRRGHRRHGHASSREVKPPHSSSTAASASRPSPSSSSSSSQSSSSSDTTPLPFRRLPWKCEYNPRWVKMDDDIFPPYIQSGECSQTECFFGMYECKPKKYVIKVLKRKKHQRCNVLPREGLNSVYEEAWEVSKVKVIVSCECGVKS